MPEGRLLDGGAGRDVEREVDGRLGGSVPCRSSRKQERDRAALVPQSEDAEREGRDHAR